jgi:ribosomal protein S18 acetylase RimI-like enzyme
VEVDLRRLPAEEAPVRRFVRRLWLPYHRELEATVETHELADDVDLVDEEVPFRLDRLDTDGYRLWVAVDGSESDAPGETAPLASTDGDLVGFVATEIERAPSVFDRPDRLVVGDIYVREGYRGTGLAGDLVDRAAERAGETDCDELVLDVDIDNERAVAFYEKLGFETRRHRMRVAVDEL